MNLNDKLTKEQFLERLEENKFFESPEELINYRYPCLVYFKENYLPSIQTLMGPAHLLFGNEVYDDSKFTAVNRAWEVLVKNINNFK